VRRYALAPAVPASCRGFGAPLPDQPQWTLLSGVQVYRGVGRQAEFRKLPFLGKRAAHARVHVIAVAVTEVAVDGQL
jgi:hypothetical protein